MHIHYDTYLVVGARIKQKVNKNINSRKVRVTELSVYIDGRQVGNSHPSLNIAL